VNVGQTLVGNIQKARDEDAARVVVRGFVCVG
jgi:hypothetical protein